MLVDIDEWRVDERDAENGVSQGAEKHREGWRVGKIV